METTGGEHGVTWLYPPPGRTLNYLDTINITYTSPFASPLLYTWCRNASMPQDDAISERRDKVPTNGTFSILLDYKDVSSCYWQLRPNTTRGNGAQSQAIVLLPTQRSPAPAIWGLESEPSEPSSTPSATPSPIPSPIPNSQSGLSTGAKAGIGIGAGIFGIALIAFIFWFVSRRRRQNSTPNPENAYEKSQGDVVGPFPPAPSYDSSIAKPAVGVLSGQESDNRISELGVPEPETVELDSRSVVHELGSGHPKTPPDATRH